jgi:hypothetical protein
MKVTPGSFNANWERGFLCQDALLTRGSNSRTGRVPDRPNSSDSEQGSSGTEMEGRVISGYFVDRVMRLSSGAIRNMAVIHNGSSREPLRWPKEARDLARQNTNAAGVKLSGLVSTLVAETGHPRWACWRFVRSMGIESKRAQRSWTTVERQRLLKLLDLHPVNEISKLMRRSPSSIWHMLYRLDANAKMGKDSFTKYTLAVALHVCPEKIEQWILRGWLKSRQMQIGRTVIDAADFCEFCKAHTRDVVGNRLTKERLDFVYRFVFPPSHAELLPVRQSKRERIAYDAQVLGEADYVGAAFDSEDFDKADDASC